MAGRILTTPLQDCGLALCGLGWCGCSDVRTRRELTGPNTAFSEVAR
jgi:hypothetical protein